MGFLVSAFEDYLAKEFFNIFNSEFYGVIKVN